MQRSIALVIVLAAAAAAAAAAACSKDRQSEGLPPAREWSADPTGGTSMGTPPPPRQANPHGGAADPSNPHAGVDMGGGGANPHAGVDMGGGGGANPHAGVDMGGGGGANPHAGVDMGGGGGGTDVTKLLPAPDPNRAIDPTHRIRGVIKIDPKAKDRVKAGIALYVLAKRVDAAGVPSGPPLAVAKLAWQSDGMAFELTEAQAMTAGTQLVGDVVVQGHYAQDGDALSKAPGDILGSVRVTIPADNVKLVLDNVL